MTLRYVAIGDSTVEGLDDPDGSGGYRGWADRLAEHLAAAHGDVAYANLAVRGRRTREVRDEQLPAALALRPDIVAVVCGVNDLLRPRFDLERVMADIEIIQRALAGVGADVVTFTQPRPAIAVLAPLRGRVGAYNAGLRGVCARTGARLLDLAAHPAASDPRLWSEDRLHANAAGHERIAAGLAAALGCGDVDEAWLEPLPPSAARSARERLAGEARWTARHLLPWLARRALRRSSGDGRRAKRPALEPVRAAPSR